MYCLHISYLYLHTTVGDPEVNLRGVEGRVGEGTVGVSHPIGGGSGGPTRENVEKMKQNGTIWSANQAFVTHSNFAVSPVKLHKIYLYIAKKYP